MTALIQITTQSPSDKDVLKVWEDCSGHSQILAGIHLMQLVYPQHSWDQLLDKPLGERDAALLHLRGLLFGERLENVANCPACSEKIEWELRLHDLRLQSPDPDEFGAATTYAFDTVGKEQLYFRLPTSRDLIALTESQRPALDDVLLKRCLDIVGVEQSHLVKALQPETERKLLERMAALSPQVDLNFQLSCPNCNTAWELPFDILQYLWEEIDTWANRILGEVASLASHFGWTESEVLSLSRKRRNYYLNYIQA